MELDKATLDSIARYDPATGVFFNLHRRGPYKAGSPSGTKTRAGYVRMNVRGELHYAHRLAWLTTHGSMPKGVIDHINGEKADNRIENLRDVCHAENLQNQFRPTGANPYLGVSLVRGRWQSVCMRFGLSLHLGMFDTAEAASIAYQEVKLLSHQEFLIKAKQSRRRNHLARQLWRALEEFPGFDCTQQQRDAWNSLRAEALI